MHEGAKAKAKREEENNDLISKEPNFNSKFLGQSQEDGNIFPQLLDFPHSFTSPCRPM